MADAGRLVLLASSPRVAPGLLSAEAWSLLAAADAVLLGVPDHPLRAPLESAGVAAELVDDPALAAPLALAGHLLRRARGGTAVWVLSPDGDSGLAEALGAVDDPEVDEVPVDLVVGSWDLPGARVLDLVAVMDRLRSPGGCPWDAEQTHLSLVEYLVEESYETVEAIETGDDDALREELGDLLLQVAFHARIAEEHEQPWSIDDVADGIAAKLVSRHPHVFADHDARTPDEVEQNWKLLKAQEKQRASVTDGIPQALPALVLAAKLLRRSADVEVDLVDPALEGEAVRAWDEVVALGPSAVGDVLLAWVDLARNAGIDLEQELREAVRRHRARIRAAEGLDD